MDILITNRKLPFIHSESVPSSRSKAACTATAKKEKMLVTVELTTTTTTTTKKKKTPFLNQFHRIDDFVIYMIHNLLV